MAGRSSSDLARLRNVNLARLFHLIQLFAPAARSNRLASNSVHGRPDRVLPLSAARLACILILATTLRQRTKSSGRPAQRENHLSLIATQPHFSPLMIIRRQKENKCGTDRRQSPRFRWKHRRTGPELLCYVVTRRLRRSAVGGKPAARIAIRRIAGKLNQFMPSQGYHQVPLAAAHLANI